jgi:hypothetical protein
MKWTRREMLLGLCGLGGAAALGGCGGGAGPAKPTAPPGAGAGRGPGPGGDGPLFGDQEREALEAALDRLMPGCREAGAMHYVDYWLSRPEFGGVYRYIRAGARHLNRVARGTHHKFFAALPAEAQDALLRRFQEGEIRAGRFQGQSFFRRLLELSVESYLGHPRYGGNRDRAGWKFIGKPDGLRSCWWNPKGVKAVLDPEWGSTD